MNMSELEEEYDYNREPEPEERIRNAHTIRSRYFFAMMSFLVALLFLSIYLNNYYSFTSGWLLLLGVCAFGAVGMLFLWPNSVLNRTINSRANYQVGQVEGTLMEDDDQSLDEGDDACDGDLSLFEQLVEEALSTIPDEFHEKMENVLVRVQYEPGEEVMKRVGIKEGYTLLGLYEGVPLTAYGYDRVAHPEVITIFQRAIEFYCHGDPDLIREQVRHTVLHEVAHHFGIDHDEMPIWVR